jgi:hypothetical protein
MPIYQPRGLGQVLLPCKIKVMIHMWMTILMLWLSHMSIQENVNWIWVWFHKNRSIHCKYFFIIIPKTRVSKSLFYCIKFIICSWNNNLRVGAVVIDMQEQTYFINYRNLPDKVPHHIPGNLDFKTWQFL